jgi:hypothetical protein
MTLFNIKIKQAQGFARACCEKVDCSFSGENV